MRATRGVITPVWARHVWYLVKLFFVVDETGSVKVLDDIGWAADGLLSLSTRTLLLWSLYKYFSSPTELVTQTEHELIR